MSRRMLAMLAALLGLAVVAAWLLSGAGLAWWHLMGLAASLGILVVIWLWPGLRQPDKPPP